MEAVLPTLIFFGTIVAIVYLVVTTRHKEKMTMLDKGVFIKQVKKPRQTLWFIRIGPPLVGVGIGLFLTFITNIGFELYYSYNQELYLRLLNYQPLLGFALCLIFFGLGFIIGYYMERSILKKQVNDSNGKFEDELIILNKEEKNEIDIFKS